MGSSQDEVEEYLKENGFGTINQISKDLKKNPSSVWSALTRLKNYGKVHFKYNGRSKMWFLNGK